MPFGSTTLQWNLRIIFVVWHPRAGSGNVGRPPSGFRGVRWNGVPIGKCHGSIRGIPQERRLRNFIRYTRLCKYIENGTVCT